MSCFLTNSSLGKKLVMSLTGCFLVLFILFHMSMNLVAIISPEGYNTICAFLGANWYARTVAVFAALPDEPATDEVLARWASTRRVVLPRVEGDAMRFYACRPDALVFGAFGILEPQGERPCPAGEIDLVVCPGVAFTADGRRLGRGRGYYDRYLGDPAFRGFRVGVCYAHQLVDDLPVEPHDMRMDRVITG